MTDQDPPEIPKSEVVTRRLRSTPPPPPDAPAVKASTGDEAKAEVPVEEKRPVEASIEARPPAPAAIDDSRAEVTARRLHDPVQRRGRMAILGAMIAGSAAVVALCARCARDERRPAASAGPIASAAAPSQTAEPSRAPDPEPSSSAPPVTDATTAVRHDPAPGASHVSRPRPASAPLAPARRGRDDVL